MTSRTEQQTGSPAPEATVNPATSTRPSQSSARVAHKAPLGWLPWLLLGLLALLLLLSLLLARAVGGDDKSSNGPARRADGAGGSAAAGAAAGAALTAGGQDVLASSGSTIGSLAGQSAKGGATVESVVADEGFWVGSAPTDRVFVFLTPQARRSNGESGFQVEKGQKVTIAGAVKRSDAGFAERVGVTAAEGRQQLIDEGGYIEATQVRLAG